MQPGELETVAVLLATSAGPARASVGGGGGRTSDITGSEIYGLDVATTAELMMQIGTFPYQVVIIHFPWTRNF